MRLKKKVLSLKESERKMRLTLNLKELFNADFTGLTEIKDSIAQSMIDTIISRTQSGVDANGSRFTPYSESYKKSRVFKLMGKNPRKVDLKLFGSMLGTLEIIDSSGSSVEIGWTDSVENAKAYNHNTGDTLPKRTFFDLSEDDILKIKEEYEDEVKELTEPSRVARKILEGVKKRDILKAVENIELPELEFE